MADLEIDALVKRYGDFVAVDGVSLRVERGEFLSLLGPSGCGKTTILRTIAGLIEPDAGSVRIDATDVTWLPPHRRNIGLVFQSYALFPHMTVFENVAFGLRQRRVPETELSKRVGEALEMVRLSGLDARFPRELSGGQQQRVALARAIAPRPALLLLDEPLSNLDAKLRDTMRIELRLLQRSLALTTVFVTHDQEESLTMSDRICLLNAGRIEQLGAPREVYEHPRTAFAASFFGRSNSFEGHMVGVGRPAMVRLADGPALSVAHLPDHLTEGSAVRVTLRHESLRVVPLDGSGGVGSAESAASASGAADANVLTGTMVLSSFAGSAMIQVVRLDDGPELTAEVPAGRSRESLPTGARVLVQVAPEDVIVMPR